jgi:serine/threonine protein phosphatase PrpC
MAMTVSLITPLDPGRPAGPPRQAPAAPFVEQALYTTAFRRLEAAVASACGHRHDANQDAHSALHGKGRIFVVADGVGGGAMARMASAQLVLQLHRALDGPRIGEARIVRAMLQADREVARCIAQASCAPGASTVVLCAPANLLASRWWVAWVGDCRVYRLAQRGPGSIELLTRDDTFAHLNETPPEGSTTDDPARMVGNGATSGANVALHDLARGDLLALCSDGIHKHLEDRDWERVLREPLPLAQRCERLVALARRNGSADDATVLLVQRSASATRAEPLP